MDNRISFDKSFYLEGRAIGEAGLETLRHALNGYAISSPAAAVELLEELRKLRKLDPSIVPTVSFKRELKVKYGHCRVMANGWTIVSAHIQLNGTPLLANLLHEWAHFVVRSHYGYVHRGRKVQSHGRQFKYELRVAYRHLEKITGIPIRANAMEETHKIAKRKVELHREFKPGTPVIINTKGWHDEPGVIVRRLRTKYMVLTRGKNYRVSARSMRAVSLTKIQLRTIRSLMKEGALT